MKHIVFSKKLFTRHPEKDFDDDGASFRFYYYKDQLPVDIGPRFGGEVFISIRLDYLRFRYPEYKDDLAILDEFNGVKETDFDMDKLVANCEYILSKYIKKGEN